VPNKNGTGAFWEMANANKRAISIDLKTEEGKSIFDKLLSEANVFLTNNRTKALKKLGLDYESMSARHPHIVWAHLNGYGEAGPNADDPGFDTIAYWAKTGQLIDFTEKNTPPLVPPIGVGDYPAGAVLAGGIAAALYKQQKTGKGEKVTISLYGLGIWALGLMFVATQGDVVSYPKTRKENTPLVNTYKCKDGEWILFSMFEWERFFPVICKLIGLETYIDDERFANMDIGMENRGILIPAMEERFMLKDSTEWIELFVQNDIPHTKVNHIKDIISDEQAKANNFIYEYKTRFTGEYYLPAPPIKFGGPYAPKHKPAPLLGENTEEVLKESGYTEEQIKDLKARKIVI